MNNLYLFSEPPRVSDKDFEIIYSKTTGESRSFIDLLTKLLSFLLLVVMTTPLLIFITFIIL